VVESSSPRVSILMPVFNAGKFINKAVASILNQTLQDFQLIIIDDASTDGTYELIQAFSDSRIQLVRKTKNTGYVDSLNMGLALTTGKYIARMDGDDISLPHRLEKQIDILESDESLGICGSNYQVIDEEGTLNPQKNWPGNSLPAFWELLWENPIAHPTVVMRTEVLRQYGFQYNTEKHPAEDYDLWCRMSLVTKIYRMDEVLLYYRVHSNSQFQKNKEAAFRNGLASLQALGIQLLGHPFPDMHIQQTIFKILLKNKEIIDPKKYYTWLTKLLELLLDKGYVQLKDKSAILKQIEFKYNGLVKEYWLNIEKFSVRKMIKFYLSPELFFLKFNMHFQFRLISKCLIGYSRTNK
jgi:glycosyltransferase involved in cell wall biosynthesis